MSANLVYAKAAPRLIPACIARIYIPGLRSRNQIFLQRYPESDIFVARSQSRNQKKIKWLLLPQGRLSIQI